MAPTLHIYLFIKQAYDYEKTILTGNLPIFTFSGHGN